MAALTNFHGVGVVPTAFDLGRGSFALQYVQQFRIQKFVSTTQALPSVTERQDKLDKTNCNGVFTLAVFRTRTGTRTDIM